MKNGIEQLTRERDNEIDRGNRERTEKLINDINVSEQLWSQSKAGLYVALVGLAAGLGFKYTSQVCYGIANYLSK